MMKKFINSQETITEEELAGFGLAYGDILTVDDHTVVSRALADADRVTIVTYGGSATSPRRRVSSGRACSTFRSTATSSPRPTAPRCSRR